MVKQKIIFMGTPDFAVLVLEALISAGYDISAVVTKPDELVGRKQILTPPPVKSWIIKNETYNIPIVQPKKLDKDFTLQVSSFNPDLIIIAAYGKIISKEILDIPSHGTLNVHPSLLPKYRGASPIQYAILNGDKETGVTIMAIDEEMDHGPILANSKLLIADMDTCESLSQRMAKIGASLLIKTIPKYISGKIKPVEQDHSKATYTKIIKKEDGKVNWSKNADEIERMTRAYYQWPTSWTMWNGKIVKIVEAEVSEENHYAISEVFLTKDNQLEIKCGNGSLVIKKLQLEGGKVLLAKEFLNGHKDFVGSILE